MLAGDCLTRAGQIAWGIRYIDDAVLRRVSSDITDNAGHALLEVTWDDMPDPISGDRVCRNWWRLTDAQHSVVAIADAAANPATHTRQSAPTASKSKAQNPQNSRELVGVGVGCDPVETEQVPPEGLEPSTR